MGKTVILVLSFLCFLGCTSEEELSNDFTDAVEQTGDQDTASDDNGETNTDAVEEKDDATTNGNGSIIEAGIIDLQALPNDSGGEQIAYPTGTTPAPYGHYVYTPSEYGKDNTAYPLIVFLHGYSARGDSSEDPTILSRIANAGPPGMINGGRWNPRFPCIVASPQLTDVTWTAAKLHEFIKYITDTYNVDESRIYLTGLSHGGDGSWIYAGAYGDGGYVSAIVPIAGSGNPNQAENLGTIPIWAFHGADDPVVRAFTNNGSVPMVEAINQTDPIYRAKLTIYDNVGHNSWNITYEGDGMGTESSSYDEFDMTIYDWMFQFKKVDIN